MVHAVVKVALSAHHAQKAVDHAPRAAQRDATNLAMDATGANALSVALANVPRLKLTAWWQRTCKAQPQTLWPWQAMCALKHAPSVPLETLKELSVATAQNGVNVGHVNPVLRMMPPHVSLKTNLSKAQPMSF